MSNHLLLLLLLPLLLLLLEQRVRRRRLGPRPVPDELRFNREALLVRLAKPAPDFSLDGPNLPCRREQAEELILRLDSVVNLGGHAVEVVVRCREVEVSAVRRWRHVVLGRVIGRVIGRGGGHGGERGRLVVCTGGRGRDLYRRLPFRQEGWPRSLVLLMQIRRAVSVAVTWRQEEEGITNNARVPRVEVDLAKVLLQVIRTREGPEPVAEEAERMEKVDLLLAEWWEFLHRGLEVSEELLI